MNPASAFFRAAVATFGIVVDVLTTIIFVWVVLSWFLFFASNSSFRWRYRKVHTVIAQLENILARMLSPLLRPFRKLLPAWKTGGIDWSPMLLLLLLFFLRYFLNLLLWG